MVTVNPQINNMGDIFNLWIKGCELNNTLIYLLEGNNDTALYKTTKTYEICNNYYNETPIYHVWICGKWIIATTNYAEAYKLWHSRKFEINKQE